jgi:hypothetical protein
MLLAVARHGRHVACLHRNGVGVPVSGTVAASAQVFVQSEIGSFAARIPTQVLCTQKVNWFPLDARLLACCSSAALSSRA